jgi:heme/copper-type cytochrome/quinol oxidase subunit 1
MTFLVQHWTGVQGQVRRTANYLFLPGDVTTLNIISSVGSCVLALSVLMFFWNVYVTWRFGVKVTEEDPLGLLQLAGMGHLLPAAAAQLLPHPADTLRAAGVRPALPAHQDRARVARADANHSRSSR